MLSDCRESFRRTSAVPHFCSSQAHYPFAHRRYLSRQKDAAPDKTPNFTTLVRHSKSGHGRQNLSGVQVPSTIKHFRYYMVLIFNWKTIFPFCLTVSKVSRTGRSTNNCLAILILQTRNCTFSNLKAGIFSLNHLILTSSSKAGLKQ